MQRLARPRALATILDHVRYAMTQFTAAGLFFAHDTTPVAEAAFLVCEALHLAPDSFETFAAARVTRYEQDGIFDLIEARIRTRKPAAYLLKKSYLHGLPFYIDERVFVPCTYIGEIFESELFASAPGKNAALIDNPAAVTRVLDLGTGSGALAVLAARRFPAAAIDAVDISADALAVAAKNVAAHELTGRITLLQGDLFTPVAGKRYDLILANLPYMDAASMAALPPECRHEPALAYDGGPDGIAVVRRIIDNAGRYLAGNAGLLCEVGCGRPVLEACYPDMSFLWLDVESLSSAAFWLDAAALG
jgi:ribosomal protein L3 glutamine methyltransferase